MEDIIDIIVTETTNTIEITSQGTDEVIDVNIIDNRDDIVLNVTPTVVEININSLTGNFGVNWGDIGGTLSSQTDLNTALGLKADLVGGKVPSSQLPSYVDDVVEVANYAALPATGETGKIYVVLDTNKIYRWSGSAYIEIADSTAVWGAITGTLSSQTDLQNALNAKFDDPTGDTTQYIAGDGSLVTFPIAGQAGTLVREVRNTTGATLTKGTVVYISGATGNKPTVSKALATGDSTSAQTFGLCQANIANNSNGYVVCVGDIVGLDTSAISEGVQLYLSSTTAGTYTTTKQVAPAHLVYIGVVTRSHPTQGQIEVKIQNGYELDEIHDVLITSKANNDGLFYESSTSLWKNKSIATILGYTPANGTNYLALAGGTMTGAIVGTTATFTNSGSGIGLGITQSGSTGDGIKITHSAGRAFNILSSAGGYGIIINNETAATSAPFTIQKQGASVISLTDAGAGTFSSSLTASSFVKTSGTSSQFLKADGSVDNSTYALDSAVVHNTGAETISGIKYFFSGSKHDLLFVSETVGYASIAGYSHFKANTDHVEFINGTNTKATKFIHGNGNYAFTMPNASGTIALTSNLSSYLPLSGGTLTGALSGTSATFTTASTVPLTVETTSGNSGIIIKTSSTTYNWLLGAQYNVGNGFEITPSTSVGGSTFTTPIFKITNTGAATFSSSVTAKGLIVVGASGGYTTGDNTYINLGGGAGGDVFGAINAPYGDRMRFNSYHGFEWYTSNAGASGTPVTKMVMASNGNVLIGATSDNGYKLRVNGNVWFDGSLNATNGAFNQAGSTSLYLSNTQVSAGSTSGVTGLYLGDVGSGVNTLTREKISVNTARTYIYTEHGYNTQAVGAYFYNGAAYQGNNSSSWSTTSDRRIKDNIRPLNNSLEKLLALNPCHFEYKNKLGQIKTGFIAQEFEEVLPGHVHEQPAGKEYEEYVGEGNTIKSIDTDLIPYLVKALQELKAELDTLKNK